MNVKENAWWIFLITLWTFYGIGALIFGDWWYVVFAVLSIATVVVTVRREAVQKSRIRFLKATIDGLERQLKEAHRHGR